MASNENLSRTSLPSMPPVFPESLIAQAYPRNAVLSDRDVAGVLGRWQNYSSHSNDEAPLP